MKRRRALATVLAVLVVALGLASGPARGVDSPEGSWSPTNPMSVQRAQHTATVLPNGDVLVVGGGSGLAEVYDAAAGIWGSPFGSGPDRTGHTASLLDGPACRGAITSRPSYCDTVLVAGGLSPPGAAQNATAGARVYDPRDAAHPTSRSTGALGAARHSHTATVLSDGKVLVTGGLGGLAGLNPLATAEIYDPDAVDPVS